jgi:hypothetical protein
MVLISRPKKTMGMVSKNDPFPKEPRRTKAIKRTANISGGPNFIAKLANVGAISMRPATLNVPPIQDPHALIKRAAPARPFLAIWYPSIQVTTEADSPGRSLR